MHRLALGRIGRKVRKMRNIPVTLDNIRFASGREAERYAELKLLLKTGDIFDLEVHPKFKFVVNGRPLLIRSKGYPNGRQAAYTADFSYLDTAGGRIVEDVKSDASKTQAYEIRKALMEALYGIVVKEIY